MFKVNKELSGQIVRSTNTLHVGDIYLEGIHYYVKPDDDKMEVLAYHLGRMANLGVVPYQSVKVRNHFYSVSKDLREDGSFLLASDVLGDTRFIIDLLDKMRKLDIYCEEMEYDFYRMYFFDFLFLNSDRNSRNFGFLKAPEGWKLVMFDHMLLFDVQYPFTMRFHDNNFQNGEALENYYHDFEQFLSFLDQEVIQVFLHMLEIYSCDAVRGEIRKVHSDKEQEYMEIYSTHYERVEKILSRGVHYGR